MGFFGSLFGGEKKEEPAKQNVSQPAAVSAATGGVPPEVIAAISASVTVVMDNDAELIAAITAAIKHAGGVPVVRIKRSNNLWAVSGRNDLMAASQSCF